MSRIVIGSDHGGFALKDFLKHKLVERGVEVEDMGCHSEESCDYPDFAQAVASAVGTGRFDQGVLVCKSGIGMSISANRIRKVRAALCYHPQAAVLARKHNNANVLVMGSLFVKDEEAWDILKSFMETPFEGGRHERRIAKIENGESGNHV